MVMNAPHSLVAFVCTSCLLLSGCLFSPSATVMGFSGSSPHRLHLPRRHCHLNGATIRRHRPSTTPALRYDFRRAISPGEDDAPSEKDDAYWDNLRRASKDPESFERFIEENMARQKEQGGAASTSSSAQKSAYDAAASAEKNDDATPAKKKQYVPIEEWDAQQKSGENMSKEERLQWECQRRGDGIRQNEILRANLKNF